MSDSIPFIHPKVCFFSQNLVSVVRIEELLKDVELSLASEDAALRKQGGGVKQ